MYYNKKFGRSFPFEGNWNCASEEEKGDSQKSLEEVSRLKGIETYDRNGGCGSRSRSLEEVSRLKGIET